MVGAGTRGAPLLPPVLLLPLLLRGAAGGIADSVVWAANAGGDAHVDVNGIHFRKDPLEGRVGRGEGGGYAAAGAFRRDSPRGRARLGSAGAVRSRCAGGVRDPRAPASVLPAAAAVALWVSLQDGGGFSPPAARGRSWPGGSAGTCHQRDHGHPCSPAGPSWGCIPRPRGGAGPGPQRRQDEPCGMVFLPSACGVV